MRGGRGVLSRCALGATRLLYLDFKDPQVHDGGAQSRQRRPASHDLTGRPHDFLYPNGFVGRRPDAGGELPVSQRPSRLSHDISRMIPCHPMTTGRRKNSSAGWWWTWSGIGVPPLVGKACAERPHLGRKVESPQLAYEKAGAFRSPRSHCLPCAPTRQPARCRRQNRPNCCSFKLPLTLIF